MPFAVESWNLVRLFGTWVDGQGAKKRGTYTVTIPVRITNATDDSIIPAGIFAQGDLNLDDGVPSLEVMVPATDDPDILETGWYVQVKLTFLGSPPETYYVAAPVANAPAPDGDDSGVNLRELPMLGEAPGYQAPYKPGVPGGLALLDSDGDVIDAAGNKVGTPGPPGGSVLSGWWSYHTGTTGPAASGQIRSSGSGVINDPITIWLNAIDKDGLDWSLVTVVPGDILYLRSASGETWRLDVDSVPGNTQINCTLISSTANPPRKNESVQVSLVRFQ